MDKSSCFKYIVSSKFNRLKVKMYDVIKFKSFFNKLKSHLEKFLNEYQKFNLSLTFSNQN